MQNLIIYTKTGCPWCLEVLSFLNEKSIKYEERNVTDNQDYMQEMIDKSGQTKAPTLDLDGEILADVGRAETEVFFKEKGII